MLLAHTTTAHDSLEPLLVPVQQAFRMLGLKNTKGYALIGEGKLRARKIGARTVVEMTSIREFAANLPAVPASTKAAA